MPPAPPQGNGKPPAPLQVLLASTAGPSFIQISTSLASCSTLEGSPRLLHRSFLPPRQPAWVTKLGWGQRNSQGWVVLGLGCLQIQRGQWIWEAPHWMGWGSSRKLWWRRTRLGRRESFGAAMGEDLVREREDWWRWRRQREKGSVWRKIGARRWRYAAGRGKILVPSCQRHVGSMSLGIVSMSQGKVPTWQGRRLFLRISPD